MKSVNHLSVCQPFTSTSSPTKSPFPAIREGEGWYSVSLPFFPHHSAERDNDQAVKYLKTRWSCYCNYVELLLGTRAHMHEVSAAVVFCARVDTHKSVCVRGRDRCTENTPRCYRQSWGLEIRYKECSLHVSFLRFAEFSKIPTKCICN